MNKELWGSIAGGDSIGRPRQVFIDVARGVGKSFCVFCHARPANLSNNQKFQTDPLPDLATSAPRHSALALGWR